MCRNWSVNVISMLVVHQSYLCDISRAFFYTVYMYHMCINRILPPTIIIIIISQHHATQLY